LEPLLFLFGKCTAATNAGIATTKLVRPLLLARLATLPTARVMILQILLLLIARRTQLFAYLDTLQLLNCLLFWEHILVCRRCKPTL
jgi:hypothetical protein